MMIESTTSSSVDEELVAALREVGRLRVEPGTLTESDDLYAAGLSSLATVDLMLAIEDRFEIEFTSEWLNRRTFQSIGALRAAVNALREQSL